MNGPPERSTEPTLHTIELEARERLVNLAAAARDGFVDERELETAARAWVRALDDRG